MIKIQIVTPVYNRRKLTLQCLKSLSRLNTEDLDVHIIIVDDGSTDGTSEAIKKEFPDVEIIQGNGNLWFTEGTNVGIRSALKYNPHYVLMINDDEVFDADFLKYMVETAEKYPRSVIGSLLLLWDEPHKLFQVSPKWALWQGGWKHWYQQTIWTLPKKPWEVDLIVGNCVLVPANAFEEHGLMNSERFPNFGDAEFTPRLRKNGWRLLIDPRARVFCQPNNIPAKVRKFTFREKFNALFIDLKNIHNLRRRLYFYLDSAPSKIQGTIAFVIFLFRVLTGKTVAENPDLGQIEKPLNEIYADAVVKD